ncbi:hypothetical protein [Catellatospora chokoriensis]|uniref:Uncharacterized protein n=1 Tax=Catellatospora chokoriensis TaxID=310353 RepID=A0A8J3NTS3_9ACTN|nr:hypothetical protein [Catellatospora chokoriensis]GIF90470.1 hypothetical protein Cch02nite_39140 [Catellatospora chokoriensis]
MSGKAITLGQFFDFLTVRHRGDIHALAGHVVDQVIDEFNRPASTDYGAARVSPAEEEVALLFERWSQWLPDARKFLTAARDYMAASLWRRLGLRSGAERATGLPHRTHPSAAPSSAHRPARRQTAHR